MQMQIDKTNKAATSSEGTNYPAPMADGFKFALRLTVAGVTMTSPWMYGTTDSASECMRRVQHEINTSKLEVER